MTAAGAHAVPDRQHAETYLRLQAEAELRKALAFPRYRPPRRGLLARSALPGMSVSRRLRRRPRAIAMRMVSQVQPARRSGRLQAHVSGLRSSRAGAMLSRFAGRAGRALGTASGLTALGIQRIIWQLRRRPGRAYQPPPAQECLRKLETLAAALADVGAIDEVTAESVIEDLRTSFAARSLIDQGELLGVPHWYRPARQAASAGPLRAIPVGATADWEVDGQVARAYLGSLILGPSTASLAVMAKFSPAAGQHSGHRMPPAMLALETCTATDDRGANYQAHFSGGGGDERWDGRLSLSPAPPVGLRWLEFTLPGAEPVRVDMAAAPPARPVTSTSLPAATAADRYLDALTANLLLAGSITEPEARRQPRLVEMPSGLLAAGVIAAGSPALGRLSAAAALVGLDLPAPLAQIRPAELPAEWLGMLARRDSHDGPTGVVAVGAALPEVDGACCVIAELHSEPEEAIVQVHARGWPSRHFSTLPAAPFRWAARDDVGGWYMIGDRGSSSSDDEADLELMLRPAINPRARTLEIILTGRTGEVSVTFPLDWQEDI
jgi:hypothetical protein